MYNDIYKDEKLFGSSKIKQNNNSLSLSLLFSSYN